MTKMGTALSEDEEITDGAESVADEHSEPEYSFEGFQVEFSEKIALMPPGQGKK